LHDPARIVLSLDLDFGRVAQESGAGLADIVRIGRGKQQGLAALRTNLDDAGKFVVEPHVGHAVGFVQHQRLYGGQLEAAAADVIENASRRADHDMGAVLQRADLRSHRRAAGQSQYLDVDGETRQPPQFLRDLVGQFASRTQHQRLDCKIGRIEFVQNADAECGGLAAAGLGLGDDVAPLQDRRQAVRLDRRHVAIAQLIEVGQHGRR
jgi:hypothetical protein